MSIILGADPVVQVQLGFEKVDMALFIGQKLVEQLLGDVIARLVTVFEGLLVKRAGLMFRRQIAFQRFLGRLADAQRIQFLQVWDALRGR